MSLLNEMLKNLDKNKSSYQRVPVMPLPNVRKNFTDKLPSIALWFPIVFALCTVFWLVAFSDDNNGSINALHQSNAPLPTAEKTSAIPQSKDNKLAVNLELRENIVETYVSSIPIIENLPNLSVEQKNIVAPAVIEEQKSVAKIFASLTDKEQQDIQINIALEAIENGDDGKALAIARSVLERDPNAISAREIIAKVYLTQGKYANAEKIVGDGLKSAPMDFNLNVIKARILFEKGQEQEALATIKPFKPDLNKDPDFYGLLAAILQKLGKINDSGVIYKALLDIDPANSQYWLGYAVALENQKANRQAIEAYRRASSSYEVDPEIRSFAEHRIRSIQG